MLSSDTDMLFLLFVAQSFHTARKILLTFAIFAKFADFSKTFLTFLFLSVLTIELFLKTEKV